MSGANEIIYISLIPVVDIETGEILEINRDDICKVSSDKKGLVFESKSTGRQYRQVRNQDEIEEAWSKYGFVSLDSTNVANLNHARVFDGETGKLYFDDLPDDTSQFVSVAKVHSKFLESIMDKYDIKHYKKVMAAYQPPEEYKPMRLFAKTRLS